MIKRILALSLLLTCISYSQEIDVTNALKKIEAGDISSAVSMLVDLKKTNPNDPSVLFLDAVLTNHGEDALYKYLTIYEKYPRSKYADAALYRIFSYHYSIGLYKKAESYLNKLRSEYPSSPYIKAADRTIPDEVDSSEIFNTHVDEMKKEELIHNFTIQAGAFINIDNANNLKLQLDSDGYESRIITKEIAGSIFNVVMVGKYSTEEEAGKTKDILNEKYSLNVRIVPITSTESNQ